MHASPIFPNFLSMNILVFTTLWPNSEQPNLGVFVKHRAVALSHLDGVSMRVVAPVPYFPKSLVVSKTPKDWQLKARIKDREMTGDLLVEHPRYLVTPKVGMRYYGQWMARGADRIVRKLHAEKPFDLVDAHYIYPDGLAALRLARALDLPVVMTARGSDINQFIRLPHIRALLQQALTGATGVVSVSDGLKQGMMELGIPSDKVAVIRNGIDRSIFYPRERAAVRRKLGLDPDRKIVMTVCSLTPRKGIDRLIDAFALLVKQPVDEGALFYVIGEGQVRAALEAQIAAQGLSERVFLVGSRLQAELPEWYAAADAFCFATHGEGCPNVVIEALACGLPVIATDIPGIDELITSPAYGRLVPPDQSVASGFAEAMAAALKTTWDREAIAAYGGARAWADVAAEVKAVFNDAVQRHRRSHGQPGSL